MACAVCHSVTCIPEAVEAVLDGVRRVLEAMDVRHVLEAVEGVCYAPEAVEVVLCVLEVPEAMLCVLLRMLEAVEGELCMLEAVLRYLDEQ